MSQDSSKGSGGNNNPKSDYKLLRDAFDLFVLGPKDPQDYNSKLNGIFKQAHDQLKQTFPQFSSSDLHPKRLLTYVPQNMLNFRIWALENLTFHQRFRITQAVTIPMFIFYLRTRTAFVMAPLFTYYICPELYAPFQLRQDQHIFQKSDEKKQIEQNDKSNQTDEK